MQDYYALLGVPDFCDSAQELRRAYKEQVLFFHPDKGNVNENIALERTQLLNEAYKTLKDPEKKARYDKELKAHLQRESYAAKKREEEKAREEEFRQEQGEQKEQEAQKQRKEETQRKASLAEIFSHAWDMLPARFVVLIAIFALFFSISLINMLAQSVRQIGNGKEIDSGVFAVNEYQHKLINSTILFRRSRDRIRETTAFLESEDAGYGSPYFYTEQKLIVMHQDSEPQPLTLSISYPGSVSIYTNQDTDAAEIVFEENVWYSASTSLHVKANHAGTTIITFSNNRNFDSFRVKIIVL